MYGFYNHFDKMRRYGGFSRAEKRALVICVLVMGLLVGFNDGRPTFEAGAWFSNLILGLIAVIIVTLVHEFTKRYWGLEAGFRVEFKPFWYGLIAGVIVAFMSYGTLIFLGYSSFRLHTLEKHRLGFFRYHLSYFQQGKIAASGSIADILLALFFKFMPFIPDAFADKIVLVAVLFAITNLLPIPPMDGAHLMYASRLVYLLVFGAVLTMGLFLVFSQVNILVVVVAATIGAVLTALFYFRNVEPRLGDYA